MSLEDQIKAEMEAPEPSNPDSAPGNNEESTTEQPEETSDGLQNEGIEGEQEEQTEEVADEDQAKEEDPEEEASKQPDGVQKAINRQTAKYYAEKKRAEELESRLQAIEQSTQQKQDVEPRLEDFDYDQDAHTEALVEFRANKRLEEARQADAQQQVHAEQMRRSTEFAQKVEAANIPDYDEVVGVLIDTFTLPLELVNTIQDLGDQGPKVVHYLGKHLDVAEKIVGMPPTKAGFELARIVNKIEGGATKPPPKKTTKAPEPIKPLQSSSGKTSKSFEEMSMEDLMKV